jgi:ComF family protein
MDGVVRQAWDAICAAVLSPRCPVCTRPIEEASHGAICRACWGAVRFITPPLCPRCGYPASGAVRCIGCEELQVVDRARALGPYDGALRDILHALKYSGRRSAAPRLAALLRERCADILDGADAAVPVPLHARRQWSRGFNQAALVAARLGLPRWPLLRRQRHTAPQAHLSAAARRQNVADAFALGWSGWARRRAVEGATLVLVDDVSTTGATLDACAAVLKRYGAREVRALVVARTLRITPAGRGSRADHEEQ